MGDREDLDARVRDMQQRIAGRLGRTWVESSARHQSPEVEALDLFIQQLYSAEALTPAVSKQTVEESVVEIRIHGQHSSNGLLVTDNGYFLTARHCVDRGEDITHGRIHLYDGISYPLEKICVDFPSADIALVKACIPLPPRPRNYRLYNTNVLTNVPAALLVRWDGKLDRKYGLVTQTRLSVRPVNVEGECYDDQFSTTIYARPGDSGGTIVSAEGQVIGLLCTGAARSSTGVKMLQGLSLIDYYRRQLEKERV